MVRHEEIDAHESRREIGVEASQAPHAGMDEQALTERGLMADDQARPPYQQNDDIGWINDAKLRETKEKRLRQMCDELTRGGVSMKMAHAPSMKS